MAFQESDYVDDTFLEEIQCDKCPYSFPLYLFAEHELMCHTFNNSDDSSSDVEEIAEASSVAQAQVENPVLQSLKEEVKTSTEEERMNSLISIAKFLSKLEVKQSDKVDQKVLENVADNDFQLTKEDINLALKNDTDDNFQVTEDDIILEDEAIALSSFSSKTKKQIEEEKPSFKASSNALLKDVYSKPHIRNDLTDSDNEEGESLEDFWKRADIKIAQRKRKMEEKIKVEQQIY